MRNRDASVEIGPCQEDTALSLKALYLLQQDIEQGGRSQVQLRTEGQAKHHPIFRRKKFSCWIVELKTD